MYTNNTRELIDVLSIVAISLYLFFTQNTILTFFDYIMYTMMWIYPVSNIVILLIVGYAFLESNKNQTLRPFMRSLLVANPNFVSSIKYSEKMSYYYTIPIAIFWVIGDNYLLFVWLVFALIRYIIQFKVLDAINKYTSIDSG